ncbi:hypothetical protein [Pseudomonas sp. Kh13]|uniref:hypothetical protein n=1 Tax=Pseudomonas sp. Kh13 TaxID=2093744 RepID=UPI00118278FA|nr:hypothetical protein [Pseudomonas sp. Kh13]
MYDIEHLNRLRADADMHNIDTTRAKLTTTVDGEYVITFERPVVDLGPWAESAPERTVTARSAESCEIRMLDGLIKLHVCERRRVRTGVVVGWSGADINRKPLTAEEIAAFKARTNPARKIEKLQEELTEALARQAARAAAAQGAADLAERYGLAAAAPVQTSKPTGTVSGRPSKAKRASRPEVNHE